MTSTDQPDVVKNANSRPLADIKPLSPDQLRFGKRMKIIPMNDQIKELQTIIRDKNTTRSEFVFYADRLIRLVVEEGLNQLSYSECDVITPTGEAMEQGLRDCCRSIRIGKILIQSDEDTHEASVVYAKFPVDVHSRKVLLMYPIMSTGNTVNKAVEVLKDHGVHEENIFLLNLFCTPHAAKSVLKAFPTMTVLTSELHPVAPNHFGQKYFGTD
ncbi:uracil phosphoribosyltransferase krishah isoform X2 [Amblyomma americanum]